MAKSLCVHISSKCWRGSHRFLICAITCRLPVLSRSKICTDPALEQLNAPANGGLREVQHVRGPAKTATLDDDECVLEIAQIER